MSESEKNDGNIEKIMLGIFILILFVVFAFWAFAFVSNPDNSDNQLGVGDLVLPDDVTLRIEYGETVVFANDAQVLDNCALQVDDWWRWEDQGDRLGYFRYEMPIIFVGGAIVYDLSSPTENGTPTVEK